MIDWGNVPAWGSVIVSTFALVAAGLAARAAFGQLGEVRKAADQRRADNAREQASKVAAWLDVDDKGAFVGLLQNSSGLPIYRTTVTFIGPNNHNPCHLNIMPPTEYPARIAIVSDLANQAAADPGSTLMDSWMINSDVEMPLNKQVKQPDGSQRWENVGNVGPTGLTVTFNDMEGRRWHRNLRGELSRVEPGASDP